ncbi:MAG: hydroxylase [candidate division Zixibacteria bacterium]|nr:hydroxylase [candidate division Zixibacteria bacterium]
MQVQYLEIVTPDVDSLCTTYEKIFGVTFGEPVAEFGNARTADLPNGGKLGVRAPLRETEQPVVRPYLLVDDIAAAVETAKAAGAEIAIPPMELPGQGTFAIYLLGGIEHGLWQR